MSRRHSSTTYKPGTDHPNAKLSEDDIREIRKLYFETNITQQKIADRFKVSQAQIGRIINGLRWSHVK